MSSYVAAHLNPQGVGDARPTALQIIEDEGLTGKLVCKVIVITGATSGIGLQTALALSTTGATLLLTARDLSKIPVTLQQLLEKSTRIFLIRMDHNSLTSVRSAAAQILDISSGKINILIANAGVMGIPERTLTEDGHELHFQTNFLSHFLLFRLLKDALISAATPESSSRVVIVASSAHRAAESPYLANEAPYEPQAAYATSNLAKIYLTNEINRRYSSRGLFANSLHPGAINTAIGRHVGAEFVKNIMSHPLVAKVLKSPEQGAATTVLAAVGKKWDGRGGKYLENCAEAERGEDDGQTFGLGWVKQTFDPQAEGQLWRHASQMVGMNESE